MGECSVENLFLRFLDIDGLLGLRVPDVQLAGEDGGRIKFEEHIEMVSKCVVARKLACFLELSKAAVNFLQLWINRRSGNICAIAQSLLLHLHVHVELGALIVEKERLIGNLVPHLNVLLGPDLP